MKMNEEIKFEEALSALEAEVKKLESGNMPLDESLAAFESAIKLVKICNEKLESAERRVRILVEDSDGTVSDADFEEIEDET